MLRVWGNTEDDSHRVPLDVDAESVACGDVHALALTVDGDVYDCSTPKPKLVEQLRLRTRRLACGGNLSAAVTYDGRLLVRKEPCRVFEDVGLADVEDVACGYDMLVVALAGGRVLVRRPQGDEVDLALDSPVRTMACRRDMAVFTTADGDVLLFDCYDASMEPVLRGYGATGACMTRDAVVAWRADGSVRVVRVDGSDAPVFDDVCARGAAATGSNQAAVTDGTAVFLCLFGQFGEWRRRALVVPGGERVEAVACGNGFTFAITREQALAVKCAVAPCTK